MSTGKKNNIEFIKASAGSGKTYTLTDRIITLLDEKDELSKKKYTLSEMMLTTFTREAAADFKRKTREKLLEKGKTKEAQELELATIGTIDSIAVKFLHRYWYKLGLGANFTELDENAKEEYVKKSLTEIVTEEDITFFNEFFLKLDIDKSFEKNSVDSNSKDDLWQNDLKGFIEKIQCHNLDDEEIENSRIRSIDMIEKLFPHVYTFENVEEARKDFLEFIDRYIEYCKDRIQSEQAIVDTSRIKKERESALKRIKTFTDGIPALEQWKDIFSKPLTIDVIHLLLSDSQKTLKKILVSPIGRADYMKKYDKALWDEIELQKSKFNDMLCSNIIKDEVVKYINRIFDLGEKWHKSFIEYKQENNLVDFSDMERLFKELLKDDDIKEELSEEIKVVMVDEFQDSNAVQIEIYNLLADIAEKNIWVGDPKQAIYRFRGTDTKTTQMLADWYAKTDGDNLNKTWRSVAPLVDFSNMIFTRSFSHDMEQNDIRLEYNDKKEELKVTDPVQEMTSSVFVWDVRPKKNGKVTEVTSQQKLAGRISEILKNGGKDVQLENDIKPSDIMILCRNNSEIKNLVSAFKEFGLPVSSSDPDVSDYLEVQLLLSILRFFIKSSDTKAMVEILHLLHDAHMEDLLNSLVDKRERQYEERRKKQNTSESETTETENKLSEITDCQWTENTRCLEELNHLKEELKGLSVPLIISGVITRLDLMRRVAKWDDGITRRENLIAVINRAESYDSLCLTKGKGATLEGFLDYLNESVELPGTPMSLDSIRIMTYHNCKGLESKIVVLDELDKDELEDNALARHFLFGAEKVFTNVPDKKNLVHFCPRFLKAPGSSFYEKQLELIKNLEEFKAYKKETRNDINKLLYVGVTRAKNKLILLKSKDNPFIWIKNIDPKTYGEDYKGVDNTDDLLTLMTPFVDRMTATDYNAPANAVKPSEYRVRKLAKRNDNNDKVFKYFSPSEATEEDVDLTLLNEPIAIESSGNRITINAHETEMNVIGTCIHNIFAVWNPDGDKTQEIQEAQDIISGNGLTEAIPHAEEVIRAAEYIYGFLSRTYGEGHMLREFPFRIRKEGRVFSGEMDLVWETENGCILLDYKNFPGTQEQFMDKTNEKHYVGGYKPQLCLYKEALEKAGKTVLATYIYYSAIGAVVKF